MDSNFRAELLNMFRNDEEFKQLFGQGGALWEQVRALEKENDSLKAQLSAVEGERNSLQEKLTESERRASTAESDFKVVLSKLEDTVRAATAEKFSLQEKLSAANDRTSKAEEEADKRLPRGWALFQKYPALSENVRRNLDIVFRRENDFAAFICGGAQENNLDIIWNTAQDALGNNQNDAALLADIFNYCLELVNASKANPCYELLQTNAGEEFDYNEHVPTGDSAAQGRIVEVLLLGYKKISNGECIIKKSIVRVM